MVKWQELGACYGSYVPGEPDIWFAPESIGGRGITGEKERVAIAKAICGGCRVQGECLDWALEFKDEWGILGGTTPQDRRGL